MKKNNRIISAYSGENSTGNTPPLCDHCGNPLRKDGFKRKSIMFSNANPPWNSSWDGRCEHCGYQFKQVHNTHGEEGFTTDVSYRILDFSPANHAFQYFRDEGIVYAGVEITVSEQQFRAPEKKIKYFLTLEELESLIKFVKKNKAIMKQLHWLEDGA